MSDTETCMSPEDELLLRHKKEQKELRAHIQKLKQAVPKGDKKQKKEFTAKAAQMEAELDERHKKENEEFSKMSGLVNDLSRSNIEGKTVGADSMALPKTEYKKQSRTQKRRDRKEAMEKEREARINEQEVVNLSGTRHVEAQKLKAKLLSRNMKVHEIASDGDCLYAAIVHQLSARINMDQTVQSLRSKSANYMRENANDFLPFLCNNETGDLYTETEFLEYCDKLENSPEWGGQLELRALSNVLRCAIVVVQADAADIVLGEEFQAERLYVSYHRHMYMLGEHYNSLVNLTAEESQGDS